MTKIALVTGGTRGIGASVSISLKKAGYNVAATYNSNTEKANAFASEHEIEVFQWNVADSAACEAGVKQVQDKMGSIDILINNAGIYRSGNFSSVNKDSWIESFITNTIGPYEVIENFLPNLMQGHEKKVVSVTSKMGSIDDNTSGGSYIYRSSKTALNSMMRSLTHDLKSHNIATMTLHPGWVRTDMGGPGGWIDVKESVSGMIDQILNLLIQNTGQYIDYDGKPIKW